MLFYLSLMVGVQNILYRQKVDIKILTDMLYDLRILKTMNLYPVYSILIQVRNQTIYIFPILHTNTFSIITAQMQMRRSTTDTNISKLLT